MKTLCEYISGDYGNNLYELQNTINNFISETNDEEQKKFAKKYLKLLSFSINVYNSLEEQEIASPNELIDLIYDYKNHEYFKQNILNDIIEFEGESCINNKDCLKEKMNDYELDSMNTFDKIFVEICNGIDLLSIDERLEMIEKYFSNYL